MKFRLSAWVFLLALAPVLGAQNAIRLKTRAPLRAAARDWFLDGPPAGHYILQFQRFPDSAVRRELTRRGARVLEYVPDNALMVSIPAGFQAAGLQGVGWLRLTARDKLSPLAAAGSGYWVVIFQPDVNMQDAQALVESYGFQVLLNPVLLPYQLLIGGDSSRLANLASWDEVSYILPASPDLVSGTPVMACGGALTEAGAVGDYVLVSQGWPADSSGVVSLQYVFGALPSQMDAATVESQVERAFALWQQYANISFSPGARADAARTIFVEFVNGAHGDAYPFTSSATLAHTFYPDPPNSEPIAGDMHFNAAESWGVGSGMDIFSVALHETGHALGLGHSDQPSAVMYPYYHLATGLTSDDIAGIQALYGPPGSGTPAASDPPASNPPASNPPASNPSATTPSAPPSLSIVSPAGTMVSTTLASLPFIGTAASGTAIASVKWNDSYGNSGAASGTSSWSVQVPLLVGANTITIRAYDTTGNSAWRSVTVVRD